VQWLVWVTHGDISKLGFKRMKGERAHITSNGTIINDVAYNRIKVKQGIERIDGKPFISSMARRKSSMC
jgi:hypothetical protein